LEALLVTTPLEVSATTTQLVLTAATRLTRLILALVAVLVVLEAMAALETTAVDWVVSQVATPTVLPPLPAVLALHRLATTTLQDLTAATWLTRLIPASTLTVMELPPVTAPLVVLEPLPVTAPLEALDTTIQLAPTAATP
jgi:hypothetical protein